MKTFSVAKHGVKALIMHASGSTHKTRLPLGSQTELNFDNKEEDSQSDKIDQPSGFSITDTDDSQDSRGREGTIFYSTLPILPAHEHSHIYLQLCM